MKTGYFARATEEGHRAKFTQVHIVNNYNKPICRYRPHKTMQFCFNANEAYLPYVECKECVKKWKKISDNIFRGKMKEYRIKLKCDCIYNVFAEDKGQAECQVDYLHYIDTERDKIKICNRKKARLLMPKDIVKMLKLLNNQNSYAPYELRLKTALHNWLKNYNRRKYN